MISFALILMTLPSRVARHGESSTGRADSSLPPRERKFSAKGAVSFKAWGSAPGNWANRNPSADSAIHFGTFPSALSRAFSAAARCYSNPGAMPQASNDIAPLALHDQGNKRKER